MTAVHTDSSLRVRCIGVRAASQSLKSPTSDTVAARGATTTNPNARALAGLEGRSGRHRTTATNTAAIASAPNGDSRMVRGRMIQRHVARTGPLVRRAGKRATCSITRASRPASTVTGRRRCRTTRPISSSSGSNTFRLSENRLQLLARPLHSHLERRHARTGQLRHLFVLEVLDVLEEKGFPVFRGQPRQRPAHHVLPLGLLGGTGVSDAVERGFVAHEDAPALCRPGARRAAPIHQNAVQPRPEPRPVVTALERAIRPDERVLERLLGVFAIAEHVHGVAGQAVTVPRDERSICVGVAAEHPAHRFPVARPHAMYTHARPPNVTSLPGSRSCDAALPGRGISHEGDLQVRCHRSWSMSRRALLTALAAVALAWAACYQDDASVTAPEAVRPQITVRLTDAPFPYDSLHSVTIYVDSIEAADSGGTSGGGEWVVITEPRKTFDLLALQQGTTALLGAGEMPAGQYHAVRMTIDTTQSAITWNDAAQTPAQVNWHGLSKIYAFIEYPVSVATQGADIVLDFDVGRSFQFNFYNSNNEFDFTPHLRAINSAAAGAIAGVVTQGANGATQPVSNAQVSVYGTYPGRADSAYLEATGRSGGDGHYKVAFLPPGSYVVRIEEPFLPNLDPVITSDVQVAAGNTTPLSVLLPNAGSSGGAYVRISGPTSVGVGGTITLFAAVGDASGNPVRNPSVTWTSSPADTASVTGF